VAEPLALPATLDGQCLAEEVIYGLACGALEAQERSQALAHLDECELCQALLADEVRGLPEFSSASGDEGDLPTLIQVGALVGGRYRIRGLLARGGMGEVYEAWDVLLAERVALKTINPLAAAADQSKASARFKQEVQLSRRVADPYVCRIYEFGQHLVRGFGPLCYLTMEFIEGQTLGARLRKGPRFALDEVLQLCRQMLRGLSAAHAVGVLHRDLKSDNVMLRAKPMRPDTLHAVIMDFGLARVLGDQAHLLTERHELVGSAAYMAPEQLEEGAALSEATDVYAFGVVLFEMLTGHLPFDGKSAVAIAMRRLTHAAPAPSSHVPELSEAWDALVRRCLERDVGRRFSCTEEVTAALEAIAQTPECPPPARTRHRRGIALTATAIAALVGGVGYLSSRGAAEVPARAAPEARGVVLPLQSAAPVEPIAPEVPSLASPVATELSVGEPAPTTEPAKAEPITAPVPVPLPGPQQRTATRPPAAVPARSRLLPAAPAAPPAPASPESAPTRAADHPEDVRDLFFLERPGDRRPQNSKK